MAQWIYYGESNQPVNMNNVLTFRQVEDFGK